VRGDATGVGDAVDPCRQPAGDGNQRTVSIDPSSVDRALRREVVDRCGHEDVVARKRDRGAIRGMQALLFDVPCHPTVAAGAEPDRGGGHHDAWTVRVRANLVDVAVDVDSGLPSCAAVRRPGKDVTLIAYGYMAQVCLDAATKAAEKGIEAEVIDLRTLVPLDEPTILSSVKKTGRAVVVYEAPRTGGYGGEISAILAEKAIEYLRGPIVRVTGFDTPFPYTLEDVYLPNADRVLAAIDKVMAF